jgi:hypothetical protein
MITTTEQAPASGKTDAGFAKGLRTAKFRHHGLAGFFASFRGCRSDGLDRLRQ